METKDVKAVLVKFDALTEPLKGSLEETLVGEREELELTLKSATSWFLVEGFISDRMLAWSLVDNGFRLAMLEVWEYLLGFIDGLGGNDES